MSPDLSPAMLRGFLRIQVGHAGNLAARLPIGRRSEDRDRRNAEKAKKAAIRKAAGVTVQQFDLAWTGRLLRADPRVRLWGAIGIVPGDLGILLLDDGSQEAGHAP